MLQTQQHEAMSRSLGGSSPGFFRVGNQIYGPVTKYNNFKHESIVYRVSKHAVAQDPGALVDRGSNGGCAGDDVTVLSYHPHRRVDIVGVANHMMNDIRIATCAAVTNSSVGPIILIMHQYAHHGKGKTIHSPGQLEYYGAVMLYQPSYMYPLSHTYSRTTLTSRYT